MITSKQKIAAKKNIKKAQDVWKKMTHRQHSLSQPEGRMRQRPGSTGKGMFYRVEVRPKREFTSFRVQDVGRKGELERVAGRRSSGSWDTVAWLVNKRKAHVSGNTLVVDDDKVHSFLKQVRGKITHIKGDIFSAHPRKNVPESEKPTLAQR